MNNYIYQAIGIESSSAVALILLIAVWSIIWKGLALWHAGKKGQPGWFVILLIVNTLGILEIIYLFAILKMKASHLFKK